MSEVLLLDLVRQLEERFAEGRYASGFALGRHILQYYPRHLLTYRLMGLAALDAGLVDDSVDLLQRALSVDPEDGQMWAALHDAATRLDLHPDAEVAGAYAHDLLQPELGVSPIARGHAAARAGDWDWAYDEYHKGFQIYPMRMDAGVGMMTALFELEQWESSLSVALQILTEMPFCLKSLWIAALSVIELGQRGDLLEKWLRKARSIDPDDIYITRWHGGVFDELSLPVSATLPAWDASESWDYTHSASSSS